MTTPRPCGRCDRVGVHHPGHGLFVGADVRGGDVVLRTDQRHDLGGVAPGHRSSSACEYSRGSIVTPPLAPPYGTSSSAHFHVIHIASARTSSRSTCGLKRRPPLAGPRE